MERVETSRNNKPEGLIMAHIWNMDIEVNDGKGDEQARFLFHGIDDLFWTDNPDKGLAFLKEQLEEHKCLPPEPKPKLTPDEIMTEFSKLRELRIMTGFKGDQLLKVLGWKFHTIPQLEDCGLWGKLVEGRAMLLDKLMALKFEEQTADMKLMEEADA